jgi:hypothetical protein
MDRRHNASVDINKVRRGLQRPSDPMKLFARLTGLTLEQMNFPRR